MKRILHVVNIYFTLPYFIGGQFKYFGEKGYKLYVACSPSEYLEDYSSKQGFDYIEIPINRSYTIIQDIKSIWSLCKYIRNNKIDIVVGHTAKGALLSMIAAWIMRVPNRIYFRHGLLYETSKGIEKMILVNIDRLTSFLSTKIVCVGSYVLQKSIEDKLSSASKLIMLGSGTCGGIDTHQKFNPYNINTKVLSRLKEKYGLNNGDFVIGFTGRLVKDKGIVELVDAFKLVRLSKTNVKLLLVGMFEERDSLPEGIRRTIIENENIIYTGFVNENIETYYALMSVYVLASYREGFGMGALEAQAMGVPVLTTRDTGCRDTIQPGKTGLYVERNAEDIKNKILMTYEGYPFNDCREWVVDNFDCRILWPEIEKLYQ